MTEKPTTATCRAAGCDWAIVAKTEPGAQRELQRHWQTQHSRKEGT